VDTGRERVGVRVGFALRSTRWMVRPDQSACFAKTCEVVGGGTSGWVAYMASALSSEMLADEKVRSILLEIFLQSTVLPLPQIITHWTLANSLT
jgi:hypothetical protein